ncbi:MAG: T9SS type A sorting domain-containing protein [Ignavibacteriaceae bacterium]|nr:T9SS type A sorting domain-containing protein [Ignavibacteriaceae bacterium]
MRTIILGVIITVVTIAQQTVKILPYDGNSYYKYGVKLSLDSTFFAVSAYNGTQSAGAVYVYRRDSTGVKLVQKILPDTISSGYLFGWPVIIKNNILYIGSRNKVHIYHRNEGMGFQRINVLPRPLNATDFGRSISISNNSILIGDPRNGIGEKGAVYVFDTLSDSEWTMTQKIVPSNVERFASFGIKISHNDKYAIISAGGDGYDSGPRRGSVFLFEKTDSGWIEKQKILPTDPTNQQIFGVEVALDNNRVAIGASGGPLPYIGRVYIFELDERGTVVLEDSIFASDSFLGNSFGYNFKLRGDSLFVGAKGTGYMVQTENDGLKIENENFAYLYVKTENGWEERMKFGATNPHPQNVFGFAVDFMNGEFLVGAPGDPTKGSQCGAAYLFRPNLVSIKNDSEVITEYALFQNYPNPFNPTTKITYQIPKEGLVTLKIYDILGKEVTTLINEEKQAGKYSIEFNASKLSSGVYLYELRSNEYKSTKKLLLMK